MAEETITILKVGTEEAVRSVNDSETTSRFSNRILVNWKLAQRNIRQPLKS